MNKAAQVSLKQKLSLRKLPMWGKKVTLDKINFEWPTEELIRGMQQDVFLQKIEFTSDHPNDPRISSVRCFLSNGH